MASLSSLPDPLLISMVHLFPVFDFLSLTPQHVGEREGRSLFSVGLIFVSMALWGAMNPALEQAETPANIPEAFRLYYLVVSVSLSGAPLSGRFASKSLIQTTMHMA